MSANKALYRSVKKAIGVRNLNYEVLANAIGYSQSAIKRFMYDLKAGRSGSRYIRHSIIKYFDGKIIEEEH